MRTPGYIVETRDGKKGRTFHNKGLIQQKVPVYLDEKASDLNQNAILCDPKSLKIIGFID